MDRDNFFLDQNVMGIVGVSLRSGDPKYFITSRLPASVLRKHSVVTKIGVKAIPLFQLHPSRPFSRALDRE